MARSSHDLVVVGAGPAGLAAAREARRRGANVLLVAAGPPGGDCTFTGCVPSKTLLAAARGHVDFPAAAARVRATIAAIAAGEDDTALAAEGITVRRGTARFTAPGRLALDAEVITAPRVVLATGSHPDVPDIPGLADLPHLTTETVFDLTELPPSLAVLGGGAVGCELAQAFARLGTRVALIEAAERLLPGEDPRASTVLAEVFTREGITVATGTAAAGVVPDPQGAILHLTNGHTLSVQRVLVAVGRRADTTGLDPAAGGVQLDARGAVITDERLATTAAGVWAAGDCTGRAMLTHAADEMGRLAAANALSRRARRYQPLTPRVVYTDPEVAQVGALESDAARTPGARAAYLPMSEVDRAVTEQRIDGFVLLTAGPRPILRGLGGGRLLGATIVAARAGEMIAEPALAIATGAFTGRLAATTHAYPTWSGAVQQAAAQFFLTYRGRAAVPASTTARADPTRAR